MFDCIATFSRNNHTNARARTHTATTHKQQKDGKKQTNATKSLWFLHALVHRYNCANSQHREKVCWTKRERQGNKSKKEKKKKRGGGKERKKGDTQESERVAFTCWSSS